MIIKKRGNDNSENSKDAPSAPKSAGNIIKAGTKRKLNPLKQKILEKKEKLTQKKEQEKPKVEEIKVDPLEAKLKEFESMEVSDIEFKERYERRRGERRRGFRRIDERALVSRAQEEAQSIRELAAKEGYKSGLLEAQSEIDMIKTALEDFTGAREAVYEEVSSHILEIAVAVAKKIIKKEVELSNDVLKSLAAEVFDELSENDEKVTVKVNPEDVEFAKVSLPEILAESHANAKMTIVGDELVEKGSCTVVATNGVIDANFSTQLAIIQNAFGIYKGGE